MGKKVIWCEPCAFKRRKTKATTGYVSAFSGEKTHCCSKCLEDYERFKREMASEPQRGAA